MTGTTQTIDLRAATGGVEYTWPLTITESSTPPKDISGDTLEVSLGTSKVPGDWITPDIDTAGANAAGVSGGAFGILKTTAGGAVAPSVSLSGTTDAPQAGALISAAFKAA
jgi:hypothetical protein